MDAMEARLRILQRLAPEERLAAVQAALPLASSAERLPLTMLVLELAAATPPRSRSRGSRARAAATRAASDGAVGLLALIWAHLPAEIRRAAIAVGRGRWAPALAVQPKSERAAAGRSLAELSMDTCDPEITAGLSDILEFDDAGAVSAGARAMLAAAIRLTDPLPPPLLGLDEDAPVFRPLLDPQPAEWSGTDLDAFCGAVAVAVERFDHHHRKEVLLAALLLLEHPSQPWGRAGRLGALAAGESEAGQALATAFRRARAPIARQRALLWAREASIASACADRVARAPTDLDHLATLPLAHLGLAPARARALRLVPIPTRPAPRDEVAPGVSPGARRLHPQAPVPGAAFGRGMSPANRRQAARLATLLKPDHAARDLALDATIADPDGPTRFIAMRGWSAPAVGEFCFDGSRAIARHAALTQSDAGGAESDRLRAGLPGRRRALARLARSPHADVRRVGREDLARLTPAVTSTAGLLGARREFARDRSGFVESLLASVRSADADEVVGGLMLARRIGAVGEIESPVLGIVAASLREGAEGDPRVVATAVGCLGALGSVRASSVLLECLRRHPDPRVRSNAAEVLGRAAAGSAGHELLAGLCDDEHHHRLRASAIRSLVASRAEPKPAIDLARAGAERLAGMLIDRRSPHRLAGVWVVQRTIAAGARLGGRWDEVTGRVRWLAESDTEASIRTRAVDVCRRIAATRALAETPR